MCLTPFYKSDTKKTVRGRSRVRDSLGLFVPAECVAAGHRDGDGFIALHLRHHVGGADFLCLLDVFEEFIEGKGTVVELEGESATAASCVAACAVIDTDAEAEENLSELVIPQTAERKAEGVVREVCAFKIGGMCHEEPFRAWWNEQEKNVRTIVKK